MLLQVESYFEIEELTGALRLINNLTTWPFDNDDDDIILVLPMFD